MIFRHFVTCSLLQRLIWSKFFCGINKDNAVWKILKWFYTDKVIHNKLLFVNLAYLSIVTQTNLRKMNKWMKKSFRLKPKTQHERNGKNNLTQELKGHLVVELSTLYWSIIRHSKYFRKGNRKEKLRYVCDKWHELDWQPILWSKKPSHWFKIIEAVWFHLDREQKKRQQTFREELWNVLWEAWRTIPEVSLKKWEESKEV